MPEPAIPPVEWGVEVWPDVDSPYNRVDVYDSRESAERLLRVSYGSATRLVCRTPGQPWQPAPTAPEVTDA